MSDEISAVIPTMGRRTLTDDVESALRQEGVEVEVVVSVDGDKDLSQSIRAKLPAECIVVWTSGRGANAARNLAIRESTKNELGEISAVLVARKEGIQ